jgi:hypothetical protein
MNICETKRKLAISTRRPFAVHGLYHATSRFSAILHLARHPGAEEDVEPLC